MGPKYILGPTKFWFKNNFWFKTNIGSKKRNLEFNKFCAQKTFCQKTFLAPQNNCVKKNVVSENNLWVQKNF